MATTFFFLKREEIQSSININDKQGRQIKFPLFARGIEQNSILREMPGVHERKKG